METVPAITTKNVSKCSAYELRQELLRRNCLDIPEDSISHRTLLQRLMIELVKDEAKTDEEKVSASVDVAAMEREAKKLERERKKNEAIQRSLQRQADKEYFEKKSTANKEQPPILTTATTQDTSEAETEEVESMSTSMDPFRTYRSTKSQKVFVK